MGNYHEAQLPCETAVTLAKASVVTTRKAQGERDRDGLATAYSNRAILNRLLQRHAAAELDFFIRVTSKASAKYDQAQPRCGHKKHNDSC